MAPQDCTLTWWGHAFVGLTVDGTTLLTDPLLHRRIGPLHYTGATPEDVDLDPAAAVLISHLHRDHLHLRSLRRLRPGTRAIVPAGAEDLVRGATDLRVEGVLPGDVVEVGGLQVRATYADHDPRRDRTGLRAQPLGFVVEGSARVYFAGDTDLFDEMAAIGPVDVALLPVGGWGLTLPTGHLDPVHASRALALLRPRFAVPIHYGDLRIPLAWRWRAEHRGGAAGRFARHAASDAPGCTVVAPVPGQRWRLPSAGLAVELDGEAGRG
jgi:L-ascorbate metabolism protein UlaG (beta-lactamase superfamily)